MTDAEKKARELVKAWPGHATFMGVLSNQDKDLVERIAAALQAEREAALEDAAKEAEGWWEMFQFDSFHHHDPRRFANPNQIAACIRALKGEGRKDDE